MVKLIKVLNVPLFITYLVAAYHFCRQEWLSLLAIMAVMVVISFSVLFLKEIVAQKISVGFYGKPMHEDIADLIDEYNAKYKERK